MDFVYSGVYVYSGRPAGARRGQKKRMQNEFIHTGALTEKTHIIIILKSDKNSNCIRQRFQNIENSAVFFYQIHTFVSVYM